MKSAETHLRSRLHWRGLWLPPVALVLLLGSCSSDHASQPKAYTDDVALQVFDKAYETLTDKYLKPLVPMDLAMRGMDGLTSIDPTFTAKLDGKQIQFSRGTTVIDTVNAPAAGDVTGWARMTTQAVDIGRDASPLIAQATAEEIYKAVLAAALAPLDRHTRYAGLRSARDYRAQREGFGGVGVRLKFDNGQPEIITILPDTPADSSRLRTGDVLIKVNGKSVAGLDRDSVIWRLRGDVGTDVTLTVSRKTAPRPLNYTLTRALIFSPTVYLSWRHHDAVITVTGFNQRTARNVIRTLNRLRRGNRKLDGIILDLRGNPGGLLDQAVAVADAFLTHGRIVTTRGRHPDSFQLFDARGRDLAEHTRVAVLINGQSASASEIVAAALQDLGRAVVVGTNSYGKGTIQNITRLPNDGELILTWARFHAPSGYALENLGVVPNFCTNRPADADGRNVASMDVQKPVALAQLAAEASVTLAVWRTHSGYGAKGVRGLRESCPRSAEKSDKDFTVAEEVLADAQLYAGAIGASQPILARSRN